MKYLGLWYPGLRNIFWKNCKTLRPAPPPTYLMYAPLTDDIYKNIAENVDTRFDTSNYELERPLPKEKKKKVVWLMKINLLEK